MSKNKSFEIQFTLHNALESLMKLYCSKKTLFRVMFTSYFPAGYIVSKCMFKLLMTDILRFVRLKLK